MRNNNEESTENVGIIGYGFVGQATHSILDSNTANVVIYDIKNKYCNNKESLFDCTHIFVCLPTPSAESGAQNNSLITNFLKDCVEKNYKGIVIIKSTVLYRNIEPFLEKLKIVMNPEFLNQNTFIEDALNQNVILLGGDWIDVKSVIDLYLNNSKIDNNELDFEIVTHKEAIDFKYTRNLYGAYKVLFWEFIQDTTGNARKMSDLYKKMEYQTEMNQVGMDGFRGFGGACFPKDTSAWNKEFGHILTEFMLNYNKQLQ